MRLNISMKRKKGHGPHTCDIAMILGDLVDQSPIIPIFPIFTVSYL